MDILEIFNRADELFDDDRPDEAGEYLARTAQQAYCDGNYSAALSIFNELTGYYRNSGNIDAAWLCVDKILELLDRLDLWNTAPAATSLLNIASVYRAAGMPTDAISIYKKCEPIFVSEGIGDKRLAGLYNNICTAALETGRSEDALYYAEKAWHIAQKVHMDGESLQKVHSNYIAARRAAEHGRQ